MPGAGITQELFKVMLRDHVAPALRDVGFTGSGQTYALRSDVAWALIGFQKSSSSNRDSVKFTVNLKVISKEAWEAYRNDHPWVMSKKPTANTDYGIKKWRRRIGELMPAGQDHWWTLDTSSDPSELANKILHALHTYALPPFHEQVEALRVDTDR